MSVPSPIPALVSRQAVGAPEEYLQVMPEGRHVWVKEPDAATAFESMREATRQAMRLPAALRAFGVPRPGVVLH